MSLLLDHLCFRRVFCFLFEAILSVLPLPTFRHHQQ